MVHSFLGALFVHFYGVRLLKPTLVYCFNCWKLIHDANRAHPLASFSSTLYGSNWCVFIRNLQGPFGCEIEGRLMEG